MNIVEANIDNLLSFWQQAAKPFGYCFESDNLNYCYVENSDWPNRLWFRQEITEESAEAAKDQIHSNSKNLVVPYWDIDKSASCQILERAGFTERSLLIGMSFKLQERSKKQLNLKFARVLSTEQAKVWAEVYPKAFGYRISEELPTKSYKDIEFYLASYQGEPVGTAMVYQTNDVIGVYGVGVIPERRRMGFAEEIMEFVLNRAATLEASYIILQASVMGKGLYDKLGFKEDFTIKNYILNQDI